MNKGLYTQAPFKAQSVPEYCDGRLILTYTDTAEHCQTSSFTLYLLVNYLIFQLAKFESGSLS